MSGPIVLLVVGAAKSGTSWLHETLAAHPQCHFRSVKELHYFDALEGDRVEKQIVEVSAHRAGLVDRMAEASPQRRADLAKRIEDRDDWLAVLRRGGEDKAAYLDYLRAGAGDARVIGEVTPAYALLSAARLRDIARLTPDVRFVYLMRDPVARLWSHVRMIAARRAADGTVDPQRARNILKRTLQGEEGSIAARGDYRAALEKLRQATPGNRLLLLFYEELFGGEGMAQLCGFLGIAPVAAPVARRVHPGQALDMPVVLRDKAAAWLAPQYDFVARTMGRKLPQHWLENMERV